MLTKLRNIVGYVTAFFIIGIIHTNAYSQQGTKNSTQADLIIQNIATRLDKSKAAACVASANLGVIRAQNLGMPKKTVDYYTLRLNHYSEMLNLSGYMKGNPAGLQQDIQRRLEIANQTLTNSGVHLMMEGCDELFKLSNFK
jgi:hypothetical protein